MRFKEWLQFQEDGAAATTWMHGGIQDIPGAGVNTNLPVQSKISTKDGSDKRRPDEADGMKKPDAVFGFRSPEDKNRSKERPSKWIDKDRKRIPMTVIPPDTIY